MNDKGLLSIFAKEYGRDLSGIEIIEPNPMDELKLFTLAAQGDDASKLVALNLLLEHAGIKGMLSLSSDFSTLVLDIDESRPLLKISIHGTILEKGTEKDVADLWEDTLREFFKERINNSRFAMNFTPAANGSLLFSVASDKANPAREYTPIIKDYTPTIAVFLNRLGFGAHMRFINDTGASIIFGDSSAAIEIAKPCEAYSALLDLFNVPKVTAVKTLIRTDNSASLQRERFFPTSFKDGNKEDEGEVRRTGLDRQRLRFFKVHRRSEVDHGAFEGELQELTKPPSERTPARSR